MKRVMIRQSAMISPTFKGDRAWPGACRGTAVLLVLLLGLALPPRAARAQDRPKDRDCLDELIKGRDPQIVCIFPVAMTAEELAELKRITRNVLQDVSCVMNIYVDRRLLDEARADSKDHEFVAPPQPVVCDVTTKSSVVPIKFTFAPKVTFRDGVGVAATPGMDNVTGVTSLVSWPVKTWVNNSSSIRQNMLLIVNAFMKQYPVKKG